MCLSDSICVYLRIIAYSVYLGEEKTSLLLFCSHLKFARLAQSIAPVVKVQTLTLYWRTTGHVADITGHVDST